MAICANDKGVLVGRMTRLFLAEGCGDAVPDAGDWKYLGQPPVKALTTHRRPPRRKLIPLAVLFPLSLPALI